MDFDKLIEPYSEDGRTAGGQIKWLLRQGIPQASIDYAMSAVYKRIELGEKFADGNELDQELRRAAKDHHEAELTDQVKRRIEQISSNLDAEWNSLGMMRKIWEVLRGRA